MTAVLNEDIFGLIYSQTFDFDTLRSTAAATTIDEQHPLRDVVLRRLLQLPLHLSSKNLEDSKALIDHLVHNSAHAELVRDIVVTLGPSRKSIAEDEKFGRGANPEDLKQAERAETLVELLPNLLRLTENLQRLDWCRSPLPNKEVLKELSEHSRVTYVSLDCSVESITPNFQAETLDVPDLTAK